MSWFGPLSRVKEALRAHGAKTDEEGHVLLKGPFTLGLGGEECIVPPEVMFIDATGTERSLVSALQGGMHVTAII